MYRLIAIDLDGTLLTPAPHKIITPHTHDILCKAVEMGITIVIATGQTLQVLRQVCANLPLSTPQIIENGAVVANFVDGRMLYEQPFPQQYILPVLDTLRSFGFYRAYHTHNCVYVEAIRHERVPGIVHLWRRQRRLKMLRVCTRCPASS